jgi:hypothetical protein
MARLSNRLIRMAVGSPNPGPEGRLRVFQGLRQRDDRQLMIGLSLMALSYLQKTKPRKQLLYRKAVPEGTALVIHHRSSGEPRLEIVKPKKRRRR